MKVVFASNNKNKITEIQAMLPKFFEIVSLDAIGCFEDIPETADTIEGNAILKADYVTNNFGLNCFADDTGLEINALNGEPGVYSARFAGEQKSAEDNMTKVLTQLKDKNDRSAKFKTVICLNFNGEQFLFTGIAEGEIILERRGTLGFGYDPIFQPLGFDQTFAELSQDQKAQISHRGKATKKLIQKLKELSDI